MMTPKEFVAFAQEYMEQNQGRVPFNMKEGRMVLNWLAAKAAKVEDDPEFHNDYERLLKDRATRLMA